MLGIVGLASNQHGRCLLTVRKTKPQRPPLVRRNSTPILGSIRPQQQLPSNLLLSNNSGNATCRRNQSTLKCNSSSSSSSNPSDYYSSSYESDEENNTSNSDSVGKIRRGFARAGALLRASMDQPGFRLIIQTSQFIASILFVCLYIWDTYAPAPPGSPRAILELSLCTVFAIEYLQRLIVGHPDWGSKFRMVTSPRNIADLLSFAPPLIEASFKLFVPHFTFGRLDLRWVKLLRSMRVMRVGLLGSELRSLHLSTKRGGWLSAGANFRLVQLATSVFMLLFIASAIIALVEQMPFHKAIYLVATTLSTVGYGDIVATTFLGRFAILGMIALGIIFLPAQAAQFYSEFSARRVVRGSLPDWRGKPFVLLSTRLTEVRAFSDFFAEFRQAIAVGTNKFPKNTKLIALCNRPSYEFSAFQELHERAVSLVEGSAVSGQDLIRVKAERAQAVLLLADRFTTDPESEDLGLLFQVWACKSYTKSVPLFVQTLRESTVRQIAPFLDLGQDVIVSTEQTRFRMLSLSAVCAGASTLIGNLMRSSQVLPREAQSSTLAGRKWLRQYVNGTEFSFCTAAVQRHLAGQSFGEVAEWLYRTAGFVLLGVIEAGGRVRLNPGQEQLRMGTQLLVIGTEKRKVRKKLAEAYVPLDDNNQRRTKDAYEASTRTSTNKNTNPSKEAESCVPVAWGNFESDSLDAENLPCVPSSVAKDLNNEQSVKAFMYSFDHNSWAQAEQQVKGELNEETARTVAEAAGVYTTTTTTNNQQQASTAAAMTTKESEMKESESPFSGHFILCGHGGSIVPFLHYLRKAEPSRTVPIVILAPTLPQDFAEAQKRFSAVTYVSGSPTEAASLRAAGAATAKALVFLARGSRPVKTAQATGAAVEKERSTREAVMADAAALLACYGVGEESGTALTHAVVELLFTTSIEFLQPGLLLKGISSIYESDDGIKSGPGQPRKSWIMRAWQQREAVAEGLAEWQANPYYAAGRVTVPALMDTFATQSFFSRGLLTEILAEMSGDIYRDLPVNGAEKVNEKGALLRLVPLPGWFAGRTYGELFTAWSMAPSPVICVGLYRQKTENPLTRLSYVVANPPGLERLEMTDKVFVVVERPK